MEYNPEFPTPTGEELEAVRNYFKIEPDFMAVEKCYDDYRNGQIRKNAVRIIHNLYSRDENNSDAFTPYLAMNYLDRYVSRHSLPNTESTDYKNVRLLAICCFTIAVKMRTKSFSVAPLLKTLRVTYETILEWELAVLKGLNWRMRSVTAFCFLDFYYPRFSSLGFTRRSISEIIIQSTAKNSSTRYSSSLIALSSFLAATKIVDPAKYEELRPKEEVTPYLAEECLAELFDMCKKKKISIETAGTNSAASASTSTITPLAGRVASEEATPTETESIPRRPGKQVLIPDESDSNDEIVSAAEDNPIVSTVEDNPIVSAAEDKPNVSAPEDNPNVSAAEDNPNVSAQEDNPNVSAPEDNPNVSAPEDNPKELLNFALLWEPDDLNLIIPPLKSQDMAAATSEDRDENRSAAGMVKRLKTCPCHWNCDSFDGYSDTDSLNGCCDCGCCKIM